VCANILYMIAPNELDEERTVVHNVPFVERSIGCLRLVLRQCVV